MTLSQRTLDLAGSWWMRPGQVDLDLGYVEAIWQARRRVRLEELVLAHPGEHVWICEGGEPVMGFVPG
jgi:hypothetical protein